MTRQNSQSVQVPFPVNGIDENGAFGAQPKGTTADAQNVRAYDAIDRRLRGGSRPGLSKWDTDLVNGAGDDIRNINKLVATPVEAAGATTVLPVAQTRASDQVSTRTLSDGTEAAEFDITGTTAILGLTRDYNGNLYACGEISDAPAKNVWKLNADLTENWSVDANSDSSGTMSDIAYDPVTNRLAVVGARVNSLSLWILDADTGATLATADPNDAGGGSTRDVVFDSNGNIYVVSLASGSNSYKGLIKYDQNLVELWSWSCKWSSGNCTHRTVAVDSSDNVIIGGEESDEWDDTVGGTDSTTKNVWSFDSDGNLLWSYLTDDGAAGAGHATNNIYKVFVHPDETDKVYIGKEGGGDDENVIKIDISDTAAITEDWTYSISNVAADRVNAIDIDTEGNIFVGGDKTSTWTGQTGAANIWRLNYGDGSLHSNSSWPIATAGDPVQDFAFTATAATGINSTFRASITTVVSNTDILTIRGGTVRTPTSGSAALTETATNLPFSQPAFGKVFFIDGKNEVYYTPYETETDDTVSLWAPTAGTMPINPQLMALYRGRIVLSGVTTDPHNWFMAKVGAPFDWDYFPSTRTTIQAIAGNNSEAGLIGDIVTALMPYSDDLMLFGCDSSIWMSSGDPAAAGSIDRLSDKTGVAWGKAWTTGPKGEMYFAGTDGIYRLVPGESLENITDTRIKKLYDAIDRDANYVMLEWDYLQQGLTVLVVDQGWDVATTAPTVYFWEERTGAWWKDTYPQTIGPLCMFAYDADLPSDKALLFGGTDGYIRKVDDSVGYDIAANNDQTAINSYVEYPPMFMAHDRNNTKLTELNAIMGESSGDVDLLLKVAESSERLSTNASTKFKRTLSAGRNTMRPRLAANTIGLELNKSSATRWAIDSMNAVVSTQGKVRRIRSS